MSIPISIATLGMFGAGSGTGSSTVTNRGGGVVLVPEEIKKPTLKVVNVLYQDEQNKINIQVKEVK